MQKQCNYAIILIARRKEEMANVLIRNVSDEVLDKLKALAKDHNRSLQQELKEILEGFVVFSPADLTIKASEIRKKLEKKKRKFIDSTDLLRKDRGR
jgi:plasmid stability protein